MVSCNKWIPNMGDNDTQRFYHCIIFIIMLYFRSDQFILMYSNVCQTPLRDM